jgi:hypothetical protein
MPTPTYNKVIESVIRTQKRKWKNYNERQNRLAKQARVEQVLTTHNNYWNAYERRQRELANYIVRMQIAETLAKLKSARK